MFAERFDALMNIAEVTNSLLGRDVHINPSHIGRLRSGARPLPKKHEYLPAMCKYLAGHIKKEYQINSLQKLTGIGAMDLSSPENMALYLERWLLELDSDASVATGRFVSGFSKLVSKTAPVSMDISSEKAPQKYASYLYGNPGKRKAVEQFFLAVLQKKKPQILLLFSDENMAWLYEDTAFAARWADLFIKVIMKGNRVKIVHTVSRNMNEMMEAVTKWIPIYMTGMIEPYFYPRLRDGVFQRTLFIAPNTAAVVSSSVQLATDGMLNLFVTDKAALEALTLEYNSYFNLCRPLMRIFTARDEEGFKSAFENLKASSGNAYLSYSMPPLFSMPEKLINELSDQVDDLTLSSIWKKDLNLFKKNIKNHKLTLILPDPESILKKSDDPGVFFDEPFSNFNLSYTKQQYLLHIEHLRKMEKQYENLVLHFIKEFSDNTFLYVKEEVGVIMAKTNNPKTAFIISEKTMINAFWDYMRSLI